MEPELPPDPGAAPQAAPEHLPVPPREPLPEPATIVSPAVTLSAAPLPPEVPTYTDRGTGLVVFGVAQIILGLLAALMVPLVALGAFMSRLGPGGTIRPGQFLSSVATYAFMAAALLGLGIGSVQMKRWARALTLVTSWYWLIMGALVTVLLTAVLPVTMRSALAQMKHTGPDAPSPEVSTAVMAAVLTLVIIFMAFFLVVVPIAFVVFYSRKDVGETCRHRDPVERWTDRTPLPVLFASVVLFTGAMYLLVTGVTAPLFPFFGRYLTGGSGAACFLAMAALDIYLAIALFRLHSAAWWLAVSTLAIRLFSMALTYAKGDMMAAYSKIGMSDAQLQMMNSSPMLRGHVLLWWSLLSMVFFFGYLLWLKRYFKTPATMASAALPAQIG
ncbi:MAG TPA: hypothetical protein VIX37_13745 [Candidatus Sulfotelmatobacter sp.]